MGNDKAPEFSAQTLPPGTAPKESTFQPNPTDEAPPVMPDNADPEAEQTKASDTIIGSTSGDVHTGLGHPGAGQSSAEMRHDGEKGRKNPGQGLQGVGAATQEFKTVDASDPKFKQHRVLDSDEAEPGRGTIGGPAAEEREPVSADQVASERA